MIETKMLNNPSGKFIKSLPVNPLVPSVKVSEDPRAWAEMIKRVSFVVAYRQLGMVALHCPLKIAVEAIKLLVKEGYGRFDWLIPGRVGVWRRVPVPDAKNPALVIDVYVFGSKIRQKNTVFVRIGWWKMYVIEAVLATLGKIQTLVLGSEDRL